MRLDRANAPDNMPATSTMFTVNDTVLSVEGASFAGGAATFVSVDVVELFPLLVLAKLLHLLDVRLHVRADLHRVDVAALAVTDLKPARNGVNINNDIWNQSNF